MEELVWLAAMLLFLVVTSGTASAANWQEPWREPQDTASAFSTPDEYAWRLFVALNWPADVGKRASDPARPLGADGPVTWETWKNAREVFLPDGKDPGPWIDGPVVVARSMADDDPAPLQQIARTRTLSGGAAPAFDPISAEQQRNETRLSKDTYEFVRSNELYHLGGQIALATQQRTSISFPVASKEVKAQWRQISQADKPRYHWTEMVDSSGVTKLFGLTALHITTKDLPNWFWATFEHVDNPTREGNEPWQLPSRDTFSCRAGAPPDCNLSPPGIGLENTKWANYRLRGTQIEFTDSTGRHTLLANSQPERGFQLTSSCMTCHARSSIGVIAGTPTRLSIFQPTGDGYTGPADPNWYSSDTILGPATLFTQLDFVWSLFRAKPKPSP
jgi:hypothetical protein